MKRFILILSVLLFTNVSANAIYMQGFGGIGRPTHIVAPSGHMRSINNFGSNAPFIRPSSSVMRGYGRIINNNRMGYVGGRYPYMDYNDRFARPYGYYRNYSMTGNSPANNTPTRISRFDKDYKITSAKKSYTRNGVTYFE